MKEKSSPRRDDSGKGQVLVTGGAGYIGSHVCKALAGSGFKPVVFDNLVYGHEAFAKWGPLVKADLGNKEQLKRVFDEFDILGVLHFAAYTYVGESVENPGKYYRNNVVNTVNLLDAMLEAKVSNVIFSSTCATYGIPEQVPITESHSQNPINPYGRSKLFVEQIIQDFGEAYGLDYVLLRYFNAAGADPDSEIGESHDPETHLIPLTLDVPLGRRDSIKIFGTDYDTPDGTCIRDYIHVSDLADAHVLALKHLLRGGERTFFNLGNGNGFSVREVIETVKRVTRREVNHLEDKRRPGDPAVLVGSSDKIKAALDWQPKFADITQIIETAWNWHKIQFGVK